MVAGGATHVGYVRESNQDSFLIKEGFYAVADGLGGHAAGEVASSLATQLLDELVDPKTATVESLRDAVLRANLEILERSRKPGYEGMGTTLTCALVRDGHVSIAHVGDSRAYAIRGNSITQLTEDHSVVWELVRAGTLTPEEAKVHPQKNVITRCLGIDPELEVDVVELDLSCGDHLLLCTDGLSGMASDEEILATLLSAPNPKAASEALVLLALEKGGRDNVTAVVVRV